MKYIIQALNKALTRLQTWFLTRRLMYCNDRNRHREHKIQALQQANETQFIKLMNYCIQNQSAFQTVQKDAVMAEDIEQFKDYIDEYKLDKFNSVISFMRKYGLN